MRILLFCAYLLLFGSSIVAQNISKKCKTCGKPIVQCQYKGNHPQANNNYEGIENGHEWVDLGVSVLWASCNVGASKQEQCGDFFAWGEVASKEEYTWANLMDSPDFGKTFHVYNANSSEEVNLRPQDDVAHTKWGGKWRMPTSDEFNELLYKCTWKWTKINGTNGYKVTGRNGNFIFLPASGWYFDSSHDDKGEKGFYWTSTLGSSSYSAKYLYFYDGYLAINGGDRKDGQSVRPVISKSKNSNTTSTSQKMPTKNPSRLYPTKHKN